MIKQLWALRRNKENNIKEERNGDRKIYLKYPEKSEKKLKEKLEKRHVRKYINEIS